MPGIPRIAGIARTLTGTVFLAVSVFACSSGPQLQRIETQLADIQMQVLKIEKQAASKRDVAQLETTIGERIDRLAASGADIEAELSTLTHQVEQLQAKLEDTDFRLAQLAQQIATTNQEFQAFRVSAELRDAAAPPVAETQPDPADPSTLYTRSYTDFQRGNYDLAILGFRRYVESFPDTEQTDNATYWIGESYYRQQRFQQAANQFDEVITRFPGSDRVPSALLKKGYAYLELGKRSQGVLQLQHVIREYPGSDEAKLARQRLDSLGIDDGG